MTSRVYPNLNVKIVRSEHFTDVAMDCFQLIEVQFEQIQSRDHHDDPNIVIHQSNTP